MAFVADKFVMTLALAATDSEGYETNRTKTIEVRGEGVDLAAQHADALVNAQAFATAFSAVTDAEVIGYSVSSQIIEDSPSIGSANLYRELLMTLPLNDAGTKKGAFAIPAPDAAAVVGVVADPADADLLALLDEFESTGSAYISDGEVVRASNQILASRVRSVASRKTY